MHTYACVGGASGLEQAVGRLVGTMCVVTGKDEDAESAMLASWVSQVCPTPIPNICCQQIEVVDDCINTYCGLFQLYDSDICSHLPRSDPLI